MRALMVVVGLVSSVALAERPAFSASFGLSDEVLTQRQYDLVDDNDHLGLYRVTGGVGFAFERWSLDVDAAWKSGSTRQVAQQTATAALWVRGVEGGATGRWRLYRYLHPYARLGLGADWATLTLTASSTLSQTVAVVSGSATAGVQVPVKLGNGPELVFDAGLGAVLRPAFEMNALAAETDPRRDDPSKPGTLNVGQLGGPAFTFRLGVALRY